MCGERGIGPYVLCAFLWVAVRGSEEGELEEHVRVDTSVDSRWPTGVRVEVGGRPEGQHFLEIAGTGGCCLVPAWLSRDRTHTPVLGAGRCPRRGALSFGVGVCGGDELPPLAIIFLAA